MSDETEQLLQQLDAEIDNAEASGDNKTALILKAVRAENGKRRVENRELKEKIAQALADSEASIAKAASAGIRSSQLQAELDKERAERQAVLERLNAANQTVVDGLPERLRPIVPRGLGPVELREWLDAAVPVLHQPPPAPLDGAAGSKADRENATVAVDEDTATMAKALGVDPLMLAKRVKQDGNSGI